MIRRMELDDAQEVSKVAVSSFMQSVADHLSDEGVTTFMEIASTESFEERLDLQIALSRGLNYELDLIDLQAVSGIILKEGLCSGRIVVNKAPSIYAHLMKKMWYNQADMMPNTKMILKKKCLRFVNG